MNRILLAAADVDGAGMARLADARAEHVRAVLRASPGDELRVGMVDGPRGRAVVETLGADGVRLRCVFDETVPARPRVDLLLAVPRPKVLKRLYPQVAALGVDRLWLCNAWKVERAYFDTQWVKPEAYTPLLVEGAAQAADTLLPRVEVVRSFRAALEDRVGPPRAGETRLVAHPGTGRPLARTEVPAGGRVVLAVGPEGGWNDFELELLGQHGFAKVQLGTRTLRSDTACVALLSIVHAVLLGDA